MSAPLLADASALVNPVSAALPSDADYFALFESARKVLWKIDSLSQKRGYSYARLSTIAEYVGLGERQVRKIVNALVSAGWVQKVRCRYCLHLNLRRPLPTEDRFSSDLSSDLAPLEFRSHTTSSDINKKAQQQKPAPPRMPPPDLLPVVAQLIDNGISEAAARMLAAQHDEAAIRDQIEALPFRKATANAAGLLIASIRQAFALPSAVLERRREETKRAQRLQKEQERRRLLAEKERGEQEERARREAWLAALPQAERRRLEERLTLQLCKQSPILAVSQRANGNCWRAVLRQALLDHAPPLSMGRR
jgi:hypothetical protein